MNSRIVIRGYVIHLSDISLHRDLFACACLDINVCRVEIRGCTRARSYLLMAYPDICLYSTGFFLFSGIIFCDLCIVIGHLYKDPCLPVYYVRLLDYSRGHRDAHFKACTTSCLVSSVHHAILIILLLEKVLCINSISTCIWYPKMNCGFRI